MSGSFNKPRLMGNCENCYYATDKGIVTPWVDRGKLYDCHRFPTTVEKAHDGYCGEFVWKSDVASVGGDSE